MIIRKPDERGATQTDWLQSFHTFSFGEYRDPEHHHFQSLRVINHDFIQPSSGFDKHPHRDMEILTYVLQGSIQHEDSLGNTYDIKAGQFQRMTAGSGITHSEHNRSLTESTELYQIWIVPSKKNLEPCYEDLALETSAGLQLIASSKKQSNTLFIHQDVNIYRATITENHSQTLSPKKDRSIWIQVTQGNLLIDYAPLEKGAGASLENEESAKLTGQGECLIFDLKNGL